MNAVLIYRYGDPSELKYERTETPSYANDEVLVKLHATSINPVDLKMRSGEAKDRFPVKFPGILGRDISGEVVEVGIGVKTFKKGDRVFGLGMQTYAEYVIAKAEVLAILPGGLTFEQGASLPLVTLTGTQLIEQAVNIQAGQTVLITGALGAVGRSAVHAAKKLGARVVAGVYKKQIEEAAELGADSVVALDDDEAIDRLNSLDAIADTVGGSTIAKLLKALKAGGVLGSVLGEPKEAKDYDIQVHAFMAHPDAARLAQLAEDVIKGEFAIPIAKTMKLSEAAEAHRLSEKGHVGGKIILIP